MFSKISAVIIVVCCLSMPSWARAQSSVGRVGPVEDVAAAGAGESKRVEKSEPKKDDVTKKTKPSAAKKDEAKRDEHNSAQPHASAPLTAAANTAGEKPQTNSTTDAPPKASVSPAREAAPVGLIPPPPTYIAPTLVSAGEHTGATANTPKSENKPASVPAPLLSAIYRVGVGDMLDWDAQRLNFRGKRCNGFEDDPVS